MRKCFLLTHHFFLYRFTCWWGSRSLGTIIEHWIEQGRPDSLNLPFAEWPWANPLPFLSILFLVLTWRGYYCYRRSNAHEDSALQIDNLKITHRDSVSVLVVRISVCCCHCKWQHCLAWLYSVQRDVGHLIFPDGLEFEQMLINSWTPTAG